MAHNLPRPIPIGQGRTVAEIEIELQVNGQQLRRVRPLRVLAVREQGPGTEPEG